MIETVCSICLAMEKSDQVNSGLVFVWWIIAAIQFFNDVATIAEAEGHHPDLHLTGYRNVEVVLSTHAIGGLSMFDFILASKLDSINVDYSPKWLREWLNSHPAPNQ